MPLPLREPLIELDESIVRENARLWARDAGKPLWAVLKNDGYGWGLARMARITEEHCEGFCVAGAEEFRRLRAFTRKPIALFSQPALDEIAEVALDGGRPAITAPQALDVLARAGAAAGRPLRARIGLAPAAGWFGVAARDLSAVVSAARSPWLEIELWTHFTDAAVRAEEERRFAGFVAAFRDAGVAVQAVDAESTLPLSQTAARFDRARIGIGLFGAYGVAADRGSEQAEAHLRNPISVTAVEVQRFVADENTVAGYARRPVPPGTLLAVYRLGYGDGFPRALAGATLAPGTVLSIGMQYTVFAASGAGSERQIVLGPHERLHELARNAGITPHEIVVSLGRGANHIKNSDADRRDL